MTKQKKEKLKQLALRRAYNHVDSEQLNNSIPLNKTLVFAKKSLLHSEMLKIQSAFLKELTISPLPKGYKNPMASGKKRAEISQRNVETLLANLILLQAGNKDSLSISLSPNDYANSNLSAGFIDLIKLSSHQSRQMLILKKGFQNFNNRKNSRNSRIKPTLKFHELLKTVIVDEDKIISEPDDLINLREAKTKNIIPRKKWEKTISKEQARILDVIEFDLRYFNLVINEYEITYVKAKDNQRHFLYPILYTIYTDNFEQGGRFYTGRGGHQNLTKAERSTIKFNGYKTCELDFSGLHIRLLYHLAGYNYPLDKDPYIAVLEAMKKNSTSIFRHFPSIRNDLKTMLIALINGKINNKNTFQIAVERANYRLFNNWIKIKDDVLRKEKKEECETRKDNWKKAGLLDKNGKPTKVLKAFEKAHKPIANQFSTGNGLYLQNLDATIARIVMFLMMTKDSDVCVPCLPIHDSFITVADLKKELKTTMEFSYNHVLQQSTNSQKNFEIPIK